MKKIHQGMLISRNGKPYLRYYCKSTKKVDEDKLSFVLEDITCEKCLEKLEKEDGM